MKKGQVSTEFLVIITIMFLLLSVVIYLVQEQKTSVDRIKSQSDTDNTISQIGAAAGDVYSQGEGARRRVFVQIPPGYDFEKSFVGNNLININVDGTDHAFTTDFEVRGSLPATYGGHWIWTISEGNKVRIGSVMFTVDRQSIYLLMDKGVQDVEEITIQNVYGKEINGTISLLWDETDVTAQINTNSFTLADEQTQQVDITFTSSQLAGIYSGALVIDASSENITERLTVPISVEISSGDLPPPLTIEPDSWIENVSNGSVYEKEFEICTNTQTSLPSVTFAPSPGTPGDWIGNTGALGAMPPGSCLDKTFTLTVPNSTSPGIYTGFIVGTGSEQTSDSINLAFTFPGSGVDTEGPDVGEISHTPSKLFTAQSFTITSTADDSLKGNNNIKSCLIDLDWSGNWNLMVASDGEFNSPTEEVEYTYGGGVGSVGFHQVKIKCTDTLDNEGNEKSYTFRVIREILFLTKQVWRTYVEEQWFYWLLYNPANASYHSFTITNHGTVLSGVVDLNDYSSILIADYDSSSPQIIPELLNYTNAGGKLMIVANAVKSAPKDFGLTSVTASNFYQKDINLSDNTSSVVTDQFPEAIMDIFPYSSTSRALDQDYQGLKLAVMGKNLPKSNMTVLGEQNNIFIWGVYYPFSLNTNGREITKGVMNYSISQSSMGQ